MGIQVLGPLVVDGSGRLGQRDRAALLALAVRHGQSVSRDELAEAVWGDHPPASHHKNLQSCVVRLRKALGPTAIETTDHGYRLCLPDDELDAARFESQVVRARELLILGEADRVVFLLEQALGLWHGAPFADLVEWAPARREADRLEELRNDVEELLLDAQLQRGRAREILPRAHDMVRAAPMRERRWELLALAQYRTGAQGEALRTIRQLRTVLARELGIDPSPEVLSLEQSILRQDPSLQQGDAGEGPASTTCPWQGLQAYDVAEADRFFGRETEIEAGLAVLATHPLLALVGPSGSGKSSLMRAGIGARLRQRGTGAVTISPGRYPVQTLRALDAGRSGDALLVDQAEELFTLCDDPDETRAFLDRLVDEASRRPIVVALRADNMADLPAHPAFSRLVERGLYLVGGLEEDGLREAVVGPAKQAGLILEPGLVDLLVNEVRADAGALPLLSHALQETWKRREGNTLTVDGYRASGGIHGAVAQSAEQLYAQVEPAQRDTLRDLVLRLLSPGTEGEPVRTRVPRRLVAADLEHDQLIEMLVGARLVTSDDGVLEITHESLARAWPRLRGWLEDDVEGRRTLHHLSSTADAWDALGRPDSELYRGVRLARALDWATTTGATLTDVERAFLDASQARAEVEEQSAAERARTQARLIHRLRIVLTGAVVLLVLALVAGGVAAVQSRRAALSAEEARTAAVFADARRVGARALLTDDISLSLLLAAAGARLFESPETRVNLLAALARHPRLVRSAPSVGGYLGPMVLSRDGRWIAAGDENNRLHLYDAATDLPLRSFVAAPPPESGQAWVNGAFSPDDARLAAFLETTATSRPVRLLDPETMQETAELPFPSRRPSSASGVHFSAGGQHLVAALHPGGLVQGFRDNGYALVWDLRSPTAQPTRVSIGAGYQGVALSPDGRTLYSSTPLTARALPFGDVIWKRPDVAPPPPLDLNRQGTLLASPVERNSRVVVLVDTATGGTVHTLRGHRSAVRDVRFSADGSLLGSVSDDGELIVWDPGTGRKKESWETQAPWGVAFSPDNRVVRGGGDRSMLRTWDLSSTESYLEQSTRIGNADLFTQAELSPDGRRVAYRWLDGEGTGWIRFVDTLGGGATQPTRLPTFGGRQRSMGAWHPVSGQFVGYVCKGLVCKVPGVVTALDSSTGHVLQREDVVEGSGIWSLGFVDEGRRLLVGGSDGGTSVIDAETLRLRSGPFEVPAHFLTPIGDGRRAIVYEYSLDGNSTSWRVIDLDDGHVSSHGELAMFAEASASAPDGATVAVGGHTGQIVTLDVSSGHERQRSTNLGTGVLALDYSQDGQLLVSGAYDGAVSLWDADTLDLLGTVRPPQEAAPAPVTATFIGDTHDVAIASYDGRVYRWDTSLERALAFACQMAGRDLTEEEWAQYLPAHPYRPVCPDP